MHWLLSPPPDCIPEHPARPPPHEDVQSCRKVQQTLLWAALRIPAWLIFILSQHWVSCRGDTGFPHEMAARLLSHLLCSPQLLIIRQTCPRQASPPPCLCCCCSCGRRSGFGFSAPVRTCSGVSCVFWGRVSFEKSFRWTWVNLFSKLEDLKEVSPVSSPARLKTQSRDLKWLGWDLYLYFYETRDNKITVRVARRLIVPRMLEIGNLC